MELARIRVAFSVLHN